MSAPILTNYQNGINQVSGDQFNTFEQTCNIAADLRAFVGTPGLQVYMRGYTAQGDGGQGVFYWNASGTGPDDNGVTNIVPNGAASGCWTRLTAPYVAVTPLSPIANNTFLGNISGSTAIPTSTSISSFLDSAISSSVGSFIYRSSTGSWVALQPDTLGKMLQTNGIGANPTWGRALNRNNVFWVQHTASNGTGGGTFTSGAWQTRPLNTISQSGISGASLASNQITLPVGDYVVEWSSEAYRVNRNQSRLRNVTDSVTISVGVATQSGSVGGDGTSSTGYCAFSVATSSKLFELQHICETTGSTTGFGIDNTISGNSELAMFAYLIIYKVG